MPYTLTTIVAPSFHCVTHEHSRMDEHLHSLLDLAERVRSTGCRRALLDLMRSPMPSGLMDRYEFALFMAARLNPGCRVAFLLPEEQVADSRFIETVAVNRGLVVRMFASREEALDWLTSSKPTPPAPLVQFAS